MNNTNTDAKKLVKQVEDTLELYLVKKAPTLPTGVKEFIVTVAPWFTLISLIITLPLILIALGLGALVAPFAAMSNVSSTASSLFATLISLATIILEGMAIPGLFKRSRQAWNLLFYSGLLSALYSLVTFNIFGLIIGSLISFYFLFQVREYYK